MIIGDQHQYAAVKGPSVTTHFLTEERGPVPLQKYDAIQRYVRHHAVRTARDAALSS